MTASFRRSCAAATLAVVVMGFGPLAASGTAQAATGNCTANLTTKGYDVDPRSRAICTRKQAGGSQPQCVNALAALGVARAHADTACARASW
ncbi:hypothetical protein ABZ400_35970 [Streptomyces sp. NPDC005897]|uniref:hypothetical protein n=1 Tax=Streptomyces sp. NPDC005897 TaxID=3157081 RepID=UPI0033D9FCFC